MLKSFWIAVSASVAFAVYVPQADAADIPDSPCSHCLQQSIKPKDHPPHGTLTHRRYPAHHRQKDERCVAKHAWPSDTHHYTGYFVGGGAAVKGDPRSAAEGTWGWDYQGGWLKRNVALDWWHGRRSQGGRGAYKTDGPHVLKRVHEAAAR